MAPRFILGIAGRSGSGKDVAAKYMQEVWGLERYKLSQPIKGMLWSLLGDCTLNALDDNEYKDKIHPLLGCTPRKALQTLGTEWRDMIDRNLWLRCADDNLRQSNNVVISDVRFQHEIAWIAAQGGRTIRLVRSGTQIADQHISEQTEQLYGIYDHITNNGTLPELYDKLALVWQRILNEQSFKEAV